MIRGLAAAQQRLDRWEGPERYLPMGWGRCTACRRVMPEDHLHETGGQEFCEHCLAGYETAYVCNGPCAEDFARFFWQQLSGKDRTALIQGILTGGNGLDEALCREIRHVYCVPHEADFLARRAEESATREAHLFNIDGREKDFCGAF